MDTRAKSNAEFRNEVSEILARHESSFDQIHGTLQTVLTELQSMRISHSTAPIDNPFAQTETSQNRLLSTTNNTPDRNHTHLKLSFPKFSGDDPTGWIYKAEQYFDFKNVAPDQQAQLASFYLEGIALQWLRWLTKFKGPLTWNELTKAVLLRFGPTDYDDPSEALTRLKQTSTVAAYQEAFEKLSHRVDELPERYMIGCFIAGLCDDIRLDVKLKQPSTLADTIRAARLIEERNTLQKRGSSSFRCQVATFTPRPTPNNTAGVLGPPLAPKVGQTPTNSPVYVRRITSQEAQERREKGLCYYCDEKFNPGHRCQRPQMFMIEESPLLEPTIIMDLPEETELTEPLPEISFHAIAGTAHPQTFRVMGKLQNKAVTVLIDGGSTHNFIDQAIVTKFGLPVARDQKLQVMVANMDKIDCDGRCLGLILLIQNFLVQEDFYVLPAAACQVVLGVQWLATLGPIETDYSKLTMSFQQGGKPYRFQGLKQSTPTALSDKELLNLKGIALFFQITLSHEPVAVNDHPTDLDQILTEFEHVFVVPNTLPLARTHDHHIPLQPNQEPVSVRPY
ncbi:uncharacterized protein LOC114268339 [Camellia sinensis]|uniref:uncharacterized protein LOC114268339 n=1 Tax=Camellia sinensis TaxID=4442 RepID=UPI001036C97F|nr:uncharacterized protein LOC114268339 [Camellia sinensis]